MGWLRLVLLVLGVGLLIALVFGNDPAAVFASLGQLSWRFVVILLFPAIPVMIFDTLGGRPAADDRRALAARLTSVGRPLGPGRTGRLPERDMVTRARERCEVNG